MSEQNQNQNQNQSTPAQTAVGRSGGRSRRQRTLMGLTLVLILAGLAWLAYDWLVLRHYEETDNAYVQGNVVQITPQVEGTVVAIRADETDPVQAGQPLVELDAADAQVVLAQAEAALGRTVREVRALYVNNGVLQAQVRQRQADLTRTKALLVTAQDDLARRQRLGAAVSGEELAHARDTAAVALAARTAAEAALVTAREQLASNQSLTAGTAVAQHPSVQAAAAQVRQDWLTVQRMALPAPVSGHVGQRHVQLGQRVSPGTPLMTVVPLEQLWVDANFKENQLRQIRIGQPVTLTADVYGSKVVFNGQVLGLGMATGAASALLPAQNATGNWIKVVQRVPVRIALDAQQLREHPLRVGLSMLAKVDISDQSGPAVASSQNAQSLGQTQVFTHDAAGVQALIERIIAQNLGPSGGAS
ncbi:efflux RND transporter periplasmic adaptor subunit [Ottowia sp.]|uniref:efflux RND transporter periplasmic adaptor subunit n=1 Tax=Ottowia sp. TaxID=1898956 RepID=UPI003A882933